jgi:hypothetical protein
MLEATLPITPSNDATLTINAKRSVEAETGFSASGKPQVLWFGIGNGGKYNVDGGNLSQPNEPLAVNMDLYSPIPIRVVPEDQDLSALERANYRMRTKVTIDGTVYVQYWLKKLTFTDSEVDFFITDSEGDVSDYSLDAANLSPTAPDPDDPGLVNNSASKVTAQVAASLAVTGEEIAEYVNVMEDGNAAYAFVSEVGLYMGEDRTVSTLDHEDVSFDYTEAIMTELMMHRCWNGMDLSNPVTTLDLIYKFSSKQLILTE